MSVFDHQDLICPRCGDKTRREVALTLNAGRSPQHRAAILAGTFQRFPCPACGIIAAAEGPFLYVDFTAGHWFGCFPRAWEVGWRAVEREPEETWRRAVVEHSPDGVREAGEEYQIRCVFGLSRLREKLVCADAGVEDVDLELLKLDLMRRGEPLTMDAQSRPTLRLITDDQLVFTLSTREVVAAARAQLDEILADPVSWGPARREIAGGPYVDVGRLLLPGTAPIDRAPPGT